MGPKARWSLWSGFVVLWTILLLLPADFIKSLPGGDLIQSRRYLLAKTLHVTAYAFMTLISGWLQVPARFRCLLIFLLMVHATLTEVIQRYCIPGRTGALLDVGFNDIGIAIGIVLAWKWWTKKDEL